MKYAIGYIFGVAATIIACLMSFNGVKQPEIKPCKCISFREAISRKEKYDYYVDRLNNDSKKDRPRWQDSVSRQTKLIQF